VVTPAGSLTYAQLDSRANRLAHHLQGRGIGSEAIAGICVERSVEMAVGILGTLKAGGACLPLDPSYPAERLAFMVADASPAVVLTQERLLGRVPAGGPDVVCIDRPGAPSEDRDDRPERQTTLDGLAYVIYTSGSTGAPNGVMLTHRSLLNHARAAVEIYQLSPADRVLQFCSISFDVCIEELVPTWAAGGAVVLRPEDMALLGRPWLDWLRDQAVTVVNLPTAYWHEWVRDLQHLGEQVPPAIRVVIVGGEKALGRVYREWLAVGGGRSRWYNAYGPTEASVMATIYRAPASGSLGEDDRDPPIGRPLPNMEVRVVDAQGQPVPAGQVGELWIGGEGLARGYLHRPELTAERFVPDPFSEAPQTRLYRTGDLGRLLPAGDLEFVGRADDQVKVRGFRIECGEVEAALQAHPAVQQAVVVAREALAGDKRLVAYVLTADGQRVTRQELRGFLSGLLPSYMVPSAFVAMATFPLTSNGKVDRSALPAPTAEPSQLGVDLEEPTTVTEKAVAAIWSEVLGIDCLGAQDDFFELGGHSLLAAQVVARLQERLGVTLPLRAIFEAPTMAGLAGLLDGQGGGHRRGEVPPLVPQTLPADGRVPLALPQEQMWKVQTRSGTRVDNNVTALLRLSGAVDVDALRAALGQLVERHDSLRTSFPADPLGGEDPYQSINDSVSVEVRVTDVGDGPPAEQEAEVDCLIRAQDALPFQLADPPLLRFGLLRCGDAASVLALTFDHLVCDGPSAYVTLSEVAELYQARVQGRAAALRPLSGQYPDFAVWQRSWLTEARLAEQLEYWKRSLAGMPLGPALPFDRVPATPSRTIAARPLAVGPAAYEALVYLARRTRTSVFIVCVAAVSAVLSRQGLLDDVVLSTTLSGRQWPEVEGVIGNFAGTGRLRTDLSGDPTFETILARARDSVLGLFEHQDIPFFRVRDALVPDFAQRAGGRPPLALVPIELGYFRASHDHWAPGAGVVERPPLTSTAVVDPPAGSAPRLPGEPPGEIFFKGQLHPLSITLLDDGTQLWGDVSYKVDFYDQATIERLAVGLERLVEKASGAPNLRLSELDICMYTAYSGTTESIVQ